MLIQLSVLRHENHDIIRIYAKVTDDPAPESPHSKSGITSELRRAAITGEQLALEGGPLLV